MANDVVCHFSSGFERGAFHGALGFLRCGRGGGADDFWILPGDVRRCGAVIVDVDRAAAFHGTDAIGDRDPDDRAAAADELFAGLAGAEHQYICRVRAAGRDVRGRGIFRHAGAAVAGNGLESIIRRTYISTYKCIDTPANRA